jgi:MFS family permease
VFFVTMTYGTVVSFLALYAQTMNVTNVGPFFTMYAITLMITRPLFGRIADKKGFDTVMLPGYSLCPSKMLILFAARNRPVFMLAGVVYGIGFGAVQPSLQAMSVRGIPPFRRGAANRTFFTGFDLGIGLGSALWVVAQLQAYNMLYLWACVPTLISLIFYYAIGRERALLPS